MDNFKLQKEIQSFKKLGEHYKKQLGLVSIEPSDLDDNVVALVEKTVELKFYTQLHDLGNMSDFYHANKRESIDQNMAVSQQSTLLQQLLEFKNEIDQEITALKRFINTVDSRVSSDAVMQRKIQSLEVKIQDLLKRQEALSIPEYLNIEALMDKVEKLELHK